MRSQSTRTVAFLFLICLSVASYVYVNMADRSSATSEDTTEQVDGLTVEEDQKNAVTLPDVRMLQTAIEAGKRILPTS